MKNTIILLILFAACLKGYSRDVPDTAVVPFSTIPIFYSSNHDSDRIIGLVSLGNGLWANKTFWAIDLKRDRLRIADTSAMLSPLWIAINSKATGGSGTGGNVYTLNNLQRSVFVYTGSNVFTLPQTANKINGMTIYDTIQGNIVQVPIANFTFNGTSQVTFVQGSGSALQSGDKVWIDYDIGQAFGSFLMDSVKANTYTAGAGTITVADNLKQMIQKLDGNVQSNTSSLSSKQATLVSGTNIKTINGNSLLGSGDLVIAGGGGSGPTSIVLNSSGVLHTTPTTFSNDGSGNWSATMTLASQSAYTVLRRATGSGTPSFGSIDSNYFAGTFGPQVAAAQKYVVDTTLRTVTYNTYTGSWIMWVKPKGITTVEFWGIGGAGGGGGGATGASGTARGGGSGGSAPSTNRIKFVASTIPDTLYVLVGQGGSGGAAGVVGTTGGTTYVSMTSGQTGQAYLVFQANGAAGGNPGTASAGGAAPTAGGFAGPGYGQEIGFYSGTTGVSGAAGGAATGAAGASATPLSNNFPFGAGTGGAGVGTSGTTFSGGAYNTAFWATTFFSGSTGNGANGTVLTKPAQFYYGGFGGGSSDTGAGGNGGNGALGAGGGGGAGGTTGGTGGAGGNGMIIINCW